jgi:hypothetical protein
MELLGRLEFDGVGVGARWTAEVLKDNDRYLGAGGWT